MTHNYVTPTPDFLLNYTSQTYQSPPDYHTVHTTTHRYVSVIPDIIILQITPNTLYFNILIFYIFVFILQGTLIF
jgi:hypothetical protein